MPFAVREEVSRQLKAMQEARVIKPSTSQVVMVRKKDDSHRFCVDYRHLNAVIKSDTYPLLRVEDLLDQLGLNPESGPDFVAVYIDDVLQNNRRPPNSPSSHDPDN